jgi:hypothetical protein
LISTLGGCFGPMGLMMIPRLRRRRNMTRATKMVQGVAGEFAGKPWPKELLLTSSSLYHFVAIWHS